MFAPLETRYAALGDLPPDPAAFGRAPAVQRLLSDVEAPDLLERTPVAAAGYQTVLFADVRHWRAGRPIRHVGREALAGALAEPPADPIPPVPAVPLYLQLPPRHVWAQPDPEGPHEPLDGCYVIPLTRDELLVVAILGLHPDRGGLSQVTVTVPASALVEAASALPDDPFAPAMAGGTAAGFRSVRTAAELLHLVRVALAVAGP